MTPEEVQIRGTEVDVWSIMSRTDDETRFKNGRLAFSIEELSTIDFLFIPATSR
jgi:hypothetical protein